MFDELVTFLRPTYSHVREEKLRLELTREDASDAAPRLHGIGPQFSILVPESYEPPSGAHVRRIVSDSQNPVL